MSYNPNFKRPVITDDCIFRSTYSPRHRTPMEFPENSPYTKQEFKDEADINTLMARYEKTGELPAINQVAPQFLDTTGIDYQTNLEMIAEANSLFSSLPSHLRNRFHNDPAEFLDFCSNSDNRPEMADLGLLKAPEQWVDVEAAEKYLARSRPNSAPSASPSPTVAPPALTGSSE